MVGAQYIAVTRMNECFSRGLRLEIGIKIALRMVTPLSFHMIGEQLCYIISCWTNSMVSTISRRHVFQAYSRTKSFTLLLFIVNTF